MSHVHGPEGLRAVILDWAGTTVDYGCRAPAAVFLKVFHNRGIDVTPRQAREPMGMAKRDHVRTIAQMPTVAEQWRERFGRLPNEDDVDAMYAEFIPLQLDCLADYSDVIPGVPAFIDAVRAKGWKVGATTGYNREMMAICARHAAGQGYEPDVSICADDVPAGRPAPWMALEAAKGLGVYPMRAIVKIGDTYADIDEGTNGGMWTIGITRTGNELGLSQAEVDELPTEELRERIARIEAHMRRRGAHYVAAAVADCLPILDEINARVAQGERP